MRCMDKSRHGVFVSRFEGKPALKPIRRAGSRAATKCRTREPVEVLGICFERQGPSARTRRSGLNLDDDRIIAIDDPSFAIDESSRVWIEHTADEPFDYAVKRVSRSESYTVVAVKRVEVSR